MAGMRCLLPTLQPPARGLPPPRGLPLNPPAPPPTHIATVILFDKGGLYLISSKMVLIPGARRQFYISSLDQILCTRR
jgi:hypothetical protein